MNPAEEYFDVCDADDRVIGCAPRAEVHARKLLHRAVHIFVFNSRGELLIHRRSATKDECPLKLTSSASGHLAAGETYADAAQRELAEELGLTAPLEFLTRLSACEATGHEHVALFQAFTDAVPIPDALEIASIEYCPVESLVQRMQQDPDEFSSAFRLLFDWRRKHCPILKRS